MVPWSARVSAPNAHILFESSLFDLSDPLRTRSVPAALAPSACARPSVSAFPCPLDFPSPVSSCGRCQLKSIRTRGEHHSEWLLATLISHLRDRYGRGRCGRKGSRPSLLHALQGVAAMPSIEAPRATRPSYSPQVTTTVLCALHRNAVLLEANVG